MCFIDFLHFLLWLKLMTWLTISIPKLFFRYISVFCLIFLYLCDLVTLIGFTFAYYNFYHKFLKCKTKKDPKIFIAFIRVILEWHVLWWTVNLDFKEMVYLILTWGYNLTNWLQNTGHWFHISLVVLKYDFIISVS